MKIVINRCYGGFGLSHQATLRYLELKGLPCYWEIDSAWKEAYEKFGGVGPSPYLERALVHYGTQLDFMSEGNPGYFSDKDIPRDGPVLIQVIAELGKGADAESARLKVVEIPDDVDWEIEKCNGREWVAEKHRTWK